MLRRHYLLAMLFLAVPGLNLPADEPDQKSPTETITLVIDFADGSEKHFTAIRWKKGMTLLDAMKMAESHPRGIKMSMRGQGATALLTQIDDLANEGSGRNWIFRVNGKVGNKSFGIYELSAGDKVLWRFEEYR